MINNEDLEALVIAVAKAEYSGNKTFEFINDVYNTFAHDRRYKVYFGNVRNNNTGIWYIGDPDHNGQKVYIEREDDIWYARFAGDSDYDKLVAKGYRFDDGTYVGIAYYWKRI